MRTHVERLLLAADLDPAALADGEMDHAAMPADHPAVAIDDLARRLGFGPNALHQPGIIAVGNEADVLAVGLGGDLERELGRDPADFGLGQVAERKAQEIELLARRPVEEIALVAPRVGALVQLRAAAVDARAAHNGRSRGSRRQARERKR